MTRGKPTILVVADAIDERPEIDAVLREAGFAVAALGDRGRFMVAPLPDFAAVVVAVAPEREPGLLHELRTRQPGLRALIVTDPAAARPVEDDCDAPLPRPLDPRRLLHALLELVLREDLGGAALDHQGVAERGIAAARLACRENRGAVA